MELLLIGLLNILLYAVVAAVIVFIVIYVLQAMGVNLPPVVIKLLWAIVAIVVLMMLLRLLFGFPAFAGAEAHACPRITCAEAARSHSCASVRWDRASLPR